MKPRLLLVGWLWAGLPTMALAQEKAAPPRSPQLWAIIVGVGNYRDPAIVDSPPAVDQALEVLRWFRAAGWDESHQLLLRDFGTSDPGTPEAPAPNILPTRANLDWAVRQWLLPRAKRGDMVVFYYAGRAATDVTPQGPRVEPRVDYYLMPIDAFQSNPAGTGWSLDQAVDDCARRRIQVVCWLATTVQGRSTPGLVPVPLGRALNTSNPTGQDWLSRLTRWPRVTAWLAADRPPGIGQAADTITPFTTALLESLGKPDLEENLAACLKALQRDPTLKRQGFASLGGVPPDLSLWADQFGKPVSYPPPEMVLQFGHADKITGLLSSADGRLLISASMDSTLRVWSPRKRSLLGVLKGQIVGATALALSGDDRWLISGGGRGAVLVHDLKDFSLNPAPRQPHFKGVVQITMLPDRTHFVTIDRDGTAALWDLSLSPLAPKEWPEQGPGQRPRCLEVAAGGKQKLGIMAARFSNGKVRMFDARGANETQAPLPDGRVTALAIGPDAQTLAAGFDDGRLVILDVRTSRTHERKVSPSPVRGLAFSQFGWLAVNHKTGVHLVRIFPDQAKAPTAAINLIDKAAGCLTISADGRHLAICTENVGAVRVWRLDEEARPQSVFDDQGAGASTVAFTGDGQSLIIGGYDGSIATRLLEGANRSGEGSWLITANRGKVQRIDSTRSRRYLLLVDELNQAQVWDLKDRTCGRLPGAWTSGVFLSDDELVLSAAVDTSKHPGRLVQARRNGARITFNPSFFARSSGDFKVPEHLAFEGLSLSPDGARVAATASPSQVPLVCVWDTKSGELTHWISQIQDPVRSLSFSSDGRYLLTAGDSPEATLWNLAGAQAELKSPAAKFADPDARNITRAAIRPGHDQVVTGNSDGQVHLWSWKNDRVSLDSRQLVAGVLAGAVKVLTFTSDGKTLAVAGDGTTIWLGTMEPQPGPVGDLDALQPHHYEQVNSLLFWPDQPILVSGSDDTTVKFWDLKGKKLWGTFSAARTPTEPAEPLDNAPVQELDWVFYTPDGLFDATPEGAKLVRFRSQDQANRLEQFEATHFTFRLGDLLLSGKPAPLVQQADEATPVSIIPPVRSDPSLPDTELTVSLGAADLKDVRLYHNERPIPTGLDSRQSLPSQFSVRLRLLKGANRFYALASRDGAFDSRSEEVEVPYDGPVEPGRLHVVALGVGDYKRRRLGYAVRDAERLSEVLHTRGLDRAGQPGVKIVLPDSQVSQESVEKSFDEVAQRVEDRPQDTVVVFLAGHTGVFDPQKFCLLLPSYPFPRDEPQLALARDVAPRSAVPQTISPDQVLPFYVIAANLMRLKALNRLVIVDACQAEAILEDTQVAEIQKWMEIGSRRARTSYLMAARRGEPALEVDPLRHGLFTYTLLRGMGAIDPLKDPEEVTKLKLPSDADFNSDGILSTRELDSYVKQNLPEIAKLFPDLVARREAQLPVRGQATPLAKLDQRPRLQTVDDSFPLIPLLERKSR